MSQEIRGRGAQNNPANRFEKMHVSIEPSDEHDEDAEFAKPLLRTEFLRDHAKSILAENSSPDIGFRFSINPYRGCEHGCAYCYARPTHEYLGYSAGLDFESKILVKEEAPKLLREKFMSKKWEPQVVAMSGNTDCYQPVERKLELTRRCLAVFSEFRNPLVIITKNQLVTRDIDLLKPLAEVNAVRVVVSVTSLDNELASELEPRTSRPAARLAAIRTLSENGISVSVNAAPMIPGLNDHEMPKILEAAAEAGARFAGYTPVRLPLAVTEIFSTWLETHRPLRKEKVLSLIRDLRGGALNDSQFGSRMHGKGPVAEQLEQMFKVYTAKYGLNQKREPLSSEHFRRPPEVRDQLSFFES